MYIIVKLIFSRMVTYLTAAVKLMKVIDNTPSSYEVHIHQNKSLLADV